MNKERMHPGGMPETDGTPLASLRDAVIYMLGSGGIGRVATSTTGYYLASLRLAPAISARPPYQKLAAA
jgi:hypothetical protein